MTALGLQMLIPLLGAALVGIAPRRLVRPTALLAAATAAVLSWIIAVQFQVQVVGIQFYETHRWHTRMGASFSLGVDGLALAMVLLTTLLVFVAVLASAAIRERARGYYALLLLLETAVLGVFLARDWSLFYVFWELTLIPLFFLIDRWGGANRNRAALNFVLYTMGGSVFMLVALLVLYDAADVHSFDMAALATGASALSTDAQAAILLGFLIGFGVKMPVVPLHGWLPLAHVEAPSPVSILLSGVLLKMGGYGLIRIAEALPDGVAAVSGGLAVFAFISLLYGGFLAWRQTDLKAMIAYSSISHMGVVLLGIAALNATGLSGAMLQMVAHGLVAGALFLLIGLLYERTHTREIGDYSSLVRVMPRFAFFTVLAFVGAVGLPGTASFIAELHTLIGSFARWSAWVALLSMGVLLSAAYAIRTINRLFTGPVRPQMQQVADLDRTELGAVAVLSMGIVGLGVFPWYMIELLDGSVARLALLLGGH